MNKTEKDIEKKMKQIEKYERKYGFNGLLNIVKLAGTLDGLTRKLEENPEYFSLEKIKTIYDGYLKLLDMCPSNTDLAKKEEILKSICEFKAKHIDSKSLSDLP